jgi:hypothetical protein
LKPRERSEPAQQICLLLLEFLFGQETFVPEEPQGAESGRSPQSPVRRSARPNLSSSTVLKRVADVLDLRVDVIDAAGDVVDSPREIVDR